jgi:hypothetical protein
MVAGEENVQVAPARGTLGVLIPGIGAGDLAFRVCVLYGDTAYYAALNAKALDASLPGLEYYD